MEVTLENLTVICNIDKQYREEVIKIIDKIDKDLLETTISNGYIHVRLTIKIEEYLIETSDYIVNHYKKKGFYADYTYSQDEDGTIEFEVSD